LLGQETFGYYAEMVNPNMREAVMIEAIIWLRSKQSIVNIL